MEYPTRRWALTSLVEWAGKTTFMAANIDYPAYIIDGDSRWGLVKHLLTGETKFAAGITIMDPLALMEEVQAEMAKGKIKNIVVDPVTKLYSQHSRRASMAGRLTAQDRESRGYGKNVAKLHVGKADTIEVITNMAMYGVHVFYSWHKRRGVDAKGKEGVRDRISEVELNTLRQSIDIELEFMKKVNPSWQKGDKNAQNYLHGVSVVSARGMAGQAPNIGFTMWDAPGNFWNGAASRLERLIYTSFTNPSNATAWAEKRFEGDAPVDLTAEYDKKKKAWNPEMAGQMYSQWIEYIDSLVDDPDVVNKPLVEQPIQPKEESKIVYKDGSKVAKDDLEDWQIYRKMFGDVPYDFITLDRSRTMNNEKGTWE